MQLDVTDQLTDLVTQTRSIYSRLNGDLTLLMSRLGAYGENSTRYRFNTKVAPNGTDWASLMPSTIESKNGRDNILVDHGDLVRSITYHAYDDSVAIGTPEASAKYHQDGTKNMKARVIFGISVDDKTNMLGVLNQFMQEVLDESAVA